MCFPFQHDRVLDFSLFSLYNSWFFFSQMLLGFASFSSSFPNPKTPAWQLHITFMIISTQPPSSCSFLHTALKSRSFPYELDYITQEMWVAHWCRDHPSSCSAELPGPSAGTTQQQILWWRTGIIYLSCSWSSCSAQGGTFGHLIHTWILVSGLQGYKEQQPEVQSK